MRAETADRLVYMANQIARNLTHDTDPPAAMAEHIRAYWSPRMIDALLAQGDAVLEPIAAAAFARLAPTHD